MVTDLQPCTAPLLRSLHDPTPPPPQIHFKLQNSRNIFTNRRINNNALLVQVIQLSNWQSSFSFFALYFFLSLQRALSLVQIMWYSFYSLGVNSATLSKSSFFSTECLALRFGEELWRQTLPSSPPQAFSLTSLGEWRALCLKMFWKLLQTTWNRF